MATLTSSPSTITVQPAGSVPNYIANLAPGSALQVAAKLSSAFAGFAGETGDPIAVYGYSGGAYDTRRGRFMRTGGGHIDHNGNGVFGFSLYASENPTWTLFKPHTSPPSVTSFVGTQSIEAAPNGDPASTHTYNTLVYDAQNDRLVMMGLGSAAGGSGTAFPRIRALTLATNSWDAQSAHPNMAVAQPGAFACYDSSARVVWAKVTQSSSPLQRFDVVANTVSSVDDGISNYSIDTAGALDPTRRYMIAIGGYNDNGPLNTAVDMVLWDLGSYTGTRMTTYTRTLSGFPGALRSAKLGLEFHPPSGSFVAWNGGNTLYRLIPPTNPFTGAWTFQTITPGGTPLPAVGSDSYGGIYSKFRWAPYPDDASRGVFVMECVQGGSGNYSSSNVAIYKPNF